MMRRFLNDESGMTMGLVIIMVVLIGVMGAGLLTFASTDLESVIETNQGQRAMEAADIGVDAARRHLSVEDAMPVSYDATVTADNSAWYDDSTPKVLNFDGNEVRVGIRYLYPSTTSSQTRQPDRAPEVLPTYGTDVCNDTNGDGVDDDVSLPVGNADACDYPNNRNYYRVTVRGGSGDAVRQVQAIFVAQNFEFPVAYYATRDIEIAGSATEVNNLSLFANRYIKNLDPPALPAKPGTVRGTDLAYGNWAVNPYTGLENPYNAVPRQDTSLSSTSVAARAAGAAAFGIASGSPCANNSGSGLTYASSADDSKQKSQTAGATLQKYAYRDYDRDSDYKCTGTAASSQARPDFRANTWGDRANQPSGTITFPFAVGDAAADAEVIAALKEKAQAQGLYRRVDPDVDGTDFEISDSGGDDPSYPFDSELTETVMFIEFADGTDDAPIFTGVGKGHVDYTAEGDGNVVEGTIVVVNGDFNTSPSARDPFQGAIIVRDPNDADNGLDGTAINCNDNGNVMDFCNSGSFDIEGFVNVEGDIKLNGNVDGFLPAELATGLPGLFKVSQWSWRECYNTTCN
jgi:hypothetical protein